MAWRREGSRISGFGAADIFSTFGDLFEASVLIRRRGAHGYS
jgi:hypothetical protein